VISRRGRGVIALNSMSSNCYGADWTSTNELWLNKLIFYLLKYNPHSFLNLHRG
jgi:hypothetical protein